MISLEIYYIYIRITELGTMWIQRYIIDVSGLKYNLMVRYGIFAIKACLYIQELKIQKHN